MGLILEDIEVKVFQSHIKVPMIFLVPAMLIASLYVMFYLFVNSNLFQVQLEATLDHVFDGSIHLRELVINPSFRHVHVYGGTFDDAKKHRVFSVDHIDAKLNMTLLLSKRIKFEDTIITGLDLKLVIDPKTGRLNLISALGIKPKEERPSIKDSSTSGFSLDFEGIDIRDSRLRFVHNVFEFEVPHVNIPHGEVHISPNDMWMQVSSWHTERADFRFRKSLFGYIPTDAQNDWTFTMRDFELKNWRWANMGYTVEEVSANIEGYKLLLGGSMGFPDSDKGMTYDAWGTLSVDYMSTLMDYFLGDTLRFEVPSVDLLAKGSLEAIDGAIKMHASHLMAIDVFMQDVSIEATLEDDLIVLKGGEAKIHGGSLRLETGFFNILKKSYGAIVAFKNVNPNGILADMGKARSYLEGRISGRAEILGELPKKMNSFLGDPINILAHATDRYAAVTLLEDATYTRANQELFPLQQFRVKKGSSVRVTVDSAHRSSRGLFWA